MGATRRIVLLGDHEDAGRHGRILEVRDDVARIRLDGHGKIVTAVAAQWRDETREDVDSDEARRCLLGEEEDEDLLPELHKTFGEGGDVDEEDEEEDDDEYWRGGGDNLADDDDSSMEDDDDD